MEWGHVFFSLFFWLGLGVLFAATVVLRFAAKIPDRSDAGRVAAPGAGSAKLVHTIRQGRVRLSIWTSGARERMAARHHVCVDQRGPHCGDCIDCVNQALRWIREHEAIT